METKVKMKAQNIVCNPGRLVYHYTSMEVLDKILSNTNKGYITFHASSMHHLNDSTEFYYGFKQLRKLLPAIEKQIGDIDDKYRLSVTIDNEEMEITGSWSENFVDILLEGGKTPFVISTSSVGDSVPMWEMYGDGGRGVAIGLDIAPCYYQKPSNGQLIYLNTTNFDPKGINVIKVCQNLSLKHYAVRAAIDRYKEYIEKMKEAPENIQILKLHALYQISGITAPLSKHPSFSFEKEWRLIVYPDISDVCYKVNSKGEVYQYTEIHFPIEKIKKIVTGPKVNKENVDVLRLMVRHKDIIQCRVCPSKVPLR